MAAPTSFFRLPGSNADLTQYVSTQSHPHCTYKRKYLYCLWCCSYLVYRNSHYSPPYHIEEAVWYLLLLYPHHNLEPFHSSNRKLDSILRTLMSVASRLCPSTSRMGRNDKRVFHGVV
jgi:hypothetical protein